MTETMESICVWPDGQWCHSCEIGEYSWKSDDFKVYMLPDDRKTEDDIEQYVNFLVEGLQ